MIEVPAKIWRPKMISRYTCPSTPDDIVDDILDYRQFGKCMYKPKHEWTNDTARTDVIVFNEPQHDGELQKDLDFNGTVLLKRAPFGQSLDTNLVSIPTALSQFAVENLLTGRTNPL